MDLSILKHKPGKLEEYIMDFTSLTNRAGYILTGDQENPILPQIFLEHLNSQLREKIETQKEPPEKLKDIISDARKFDKSYHRNQAWKTKLMGWQPSRSLPRQHPRASYTPKERDPDAMDIDILTIKEREEYMKEGKCFRCGKKGHMSRDHTTNPALNTNKANTSNYRNPASQNKSSNATQKVRAIMAGLDDEELEKVKVAFIESLDKEEPAEEDSDNEDKGF